MRTSSVRRVCRSLFQPHIHFSANRKKNDGKESISPRVNTRLCNQLGLSPGVWNLIYTTCLAVRVPEKVALQDRGMLCDLRLHVQCRAAMVEVDSVCAVETSIQSNSRFEWKLFHTRARPSLPLT
jgi:hypothetical protein